MNDAINWWYVGAIVRSRRDQPSITQVKDFFSAYGSNALPFSKSDNLSTGDASLWPAANVSQPTFGLTRLLAPFQFRAVEAAKPEELSCFVDCFFVEPDFPIGIDNFGARVLMSNETSYVGDLTAVGHGTFLGVDVVDEGFVSAISNCGYTELESMEAKTRFADRLNESGLFSSRSDAREFAEFSDIRVPEHSPFYLLRIERYSMQSWSRRELKLAV